MAIRAELIESATQFLLDPSVASASLDSRLSFLRSKNLTQAEIDASLARAAQASQSSASSPPPPPLPPLTQPLPPLLRYQPQPSQQQYARRDWRDWFIMAAVVGGMGYGVFQFAKRYVVPLIAPPSQPQLEEAKAVVSAGLERLQAQLTQLAADTAAMRAAEEERTQRLDDALTALDGAVTSIRMAGRSRDEDAARLRDDLRELRDTLPRSMAANRDAANVRLRDLAAELTSVKALMAQRLGSAASARYPPLELAKPSENGAGEALPAATGSGLGRATPFSVKDFTKTTSIPAWQMATAKASVLAYDSEAAEAKEGDSA